MEPPIPRTLRGWIVTVLVLVLMFIAYYGFLFPYLERFYRGFLYTQPPQEMGDLTLRVDAPDYIAPFGQRWLYFTIRNDADRPMSDIWIGLEVQQPGEQTVEGWVFPFLFRDSLLLDRPIYIKQIQPGLSVSGRIPLWGSTYLSASPTLSATVIVTGPEVAGTGTSLPLSVKANSYRYLAHSFIEQILLPPWSNGFIAIAVFIVCTQMERRIKPEGEWYYQVAREFRSSLALLLLLGGGVLILPSIPWWGQDPKGVILSVLFLIFFVLYSLRVLGVEPPPPLFIKRAVSVLASVIVRRFGAGSEIPVRPEIFYITGVWRFLRSRTSLKWDADFRRLSTQILKILTTIRENLRESASKTKFARVQYIIILALIGGIGLMFRPSLPLLQPLPLMALAGAVIEVISVIISVIFGKSYREDQHESTKNSL